MSNEQAQCAALPPTEHASVGSALTSFAVLRNSPNGEQDQCVAPRQAADVSVGSALTSFDVLRNSPTTEQAQCAALPPTENASVGSALTSFAVLRNSPTTTHPLSEAGPTPAQILAQFAPVTGLDSCGVRFPAAGDLRTRFAENPLLMAPMAGVSDAAYRMMTRAGGAALAYSEMVSVAGLHYKSEKTWELVIPRDPEPDIAVQLFGAEPDQFAEAAAAVCERVGNRLRLIDVNMACPVPKVTKNGAGSALMDDAERAAAIVRACVSESAVPVTAKIRRGRRMDEEVAPEFARALQDAGAAAIAVHGRYANQFYRGEADWGVVSRVVQAVEVPVIGSGDVMSHDDALRMMRETGCAAVMIARGTYGNPWVFSGTKPTAEQRIYAFACHVRLLEATGAHMARARSLAGWYFKGMPHAAQWRNRAMSCESVDDYLTMAEELLSYVES